MTFIETIYSPQDMEWGRFVLGVVFGYLLSELVIRVQRKLKR